MAIAYEPQSVVQNLANLIKLKMIGLYGVYEALDFTTERLPLNKKSAIVREYMAHHQGMILMAMVNFSSKILWLIECIGIHVSRR